MKTIEKVKDYVVSGEEFTLRYDEHRKMFVTHPQPKIETLPSYYKSENYISHTDAKTSFIDKIYQAVKGFSVDKKVKLVTKYQPSKGLLLDIGCGTGDFLAKAKEKGWTIAGVEPNEEARARSAQKGILSKEELALVTATDFNVITLWHVLEHLPNLESQIETIVQMLSSDGVLVIAVPNYNSYDAKHYKNFWAAYDAPRHLWHFSKASIETLFKPHNFEIVKIKPMWFDSFYVSLLSEKYKTGKSNFFKAMLVGGWSNIVGCFKKEYSSHIYILKRAK